MKFNHDVEDFLTGKQFSNAKSITFIDEKQTTFDRLELLIQLTKGKKVLHLGCTDHLDLIDSKIKNNIWLHKHLCDNSEKCYGIDINEEAVTYVKDILKYDNIYLGNVLEMPLDFIKDETWDYIVLGEIIEHVNNPCEFLSILHKRLKPYVKGIIITAPNAWSLQVIKKVRQNIECINTDHKYWFTPFTLSKVIVEADFQVDEILIAYFSMPKFNFFKRAYKKKHYLQGDSIIITASF